MPLLPLLTTGYPPIQDFPAQAGLIAVLGRGMTGTIYMPAGPLTHSYLYYLSGMWIMNITGIDGYSVSLVLMGIAVTGYVAAVLWLSEELDGDMFFAAAVAGITWNRMVVMGFTPFLLSVDAAIAALALLVKIGKRPSAIIAAVLLGLITYYLHFMGYLALIFGATLLYFTYKDRISLWTFPGLSIGMFLFAAYKITENTGRITGLQFSEPGIRLIQMLTFMGPGSVSVWPDLTAGLLVVFVISITIYYRRNHPMAWLLALFVLISMGLPSYIKGIRLVYPFARYLPFFVALLFATVPKQGRKWPRLTVIVIALGLIQWTTYAFIHDGASISTQAHAIEQLPSGHTVLTLTGHWRPSDSMLDEYEAINLPFIYQARGKGPVIGPYTQPNMPIRLAPKIYSTVKLSYKNWQEYVEKGMQYADLMITDMTRIKAVTNSQAFARLRPCPQKLPQPWSCWTKRRSD